ncbi:MAG TPA: hypothetical protein VHN82_05700 [Methanoregula sp.]|nr:hypothetical protein [Methanoregula sp.]
MNRSGPAHIAAVLVIVALCCTGFAGPASAHAPLSSGSNEDIASATLISNPEKSYAIYSGFHEGGEVQYYRFEMQKGQVLQGSAGVPAPGSPVPDLVFLGPGIQPEGTVPPSIQVPAGSSARLVPGSAPGAPGFEPFSPQPLYQTANFSLIAPESGTYYVAIFGRQEGNYYFAPGFLEQFTAGEAILVPWSIIGIRFWQGQGAYEIFAPLAAVLALGIAGIALRFRKNGQKPGPVALLSIAAGLLCLGSAAMTAYQLVRTLLATGWVPEATITLALIAIPAVIGGAILRAALRLPDDGTSVWTGVFLILAGIAGLVFWAGLVIGPVLATAAGILAILHRSGN